MGITREYCMKKIVCIMGPTASGKTALGIELAKEFNGEIVSADSRMVYRGMEVGTAVPKGTLSMRTPPSGALSREILVVEGIPHYLVGVVEPNQPFTVVDWRERAIEAIDDILNRGKLPIVVGGTGLYFSTLLDNFEIPPGIADMALREKIESGIRNKESWPVEQLLALDPDAATLVDLKNPRRVARAIEVSLATGIPFTKQLATKAPLYDALQIGLSVPKEELAKRLAGRTEGQLRDGLLEEVIRLKDKYGCDVPAMQGFVYKEMCQYVAGELSLEKAKEQIDLRNRQYAKRQMTWFGRDKRIRWVEHAKDARALVQAFVD